MSGPAQYRRGRQAFPALKTLEAYQLPRSLLGAAAQSNPGAGVVRVCRECAENIVLLGPSGTGKHAPRDRVRTDCGTGRSWKGTLHDGCRSRHSAMEAAYRQGRIKEAMHRVIAAPKATDHFRRDRLSHRSDASKPICSSRVVARRYERGSLILTSNPHRSCSWARPSVRGRRQCSPPPCSTGSFITRPSFRSVVRAIGSRTSAAPASWTEPTNRSTKSKTSDHIVPCERGHSEDADGSASQCRYRQTRVRSHTCRWTAASRVLLPAR